MASLLPNVLEILSSTPPVAQEKIGDDDGHVNCVSVSGENVEYDNVEEEPELRFQTYVAIAAMFLLNMVQVVALQGPPAIVRPVSHPANTLITDSKSTAHVYRTRSQRTKAQNWVPNSLSLVQAVLAPVLASALDTFEAPVNTSWSDLTRCHLSAPLSFQVQKSSSA